MIDDTVWLLWQGYDQAGSPAVGCENIEHRWRLLSVHGTERDALRVAGWRCATDTDAFDYRVTTEPVVSARPFVDGQLDGYAIGVDVTERER